MKAMATAWRMLGRAQGVLSRLPRDPPQGRWALPVLNVRPLGPGQEHGLPSTPARFCAGESPLVGRMRDSQQEPRTLSQGPGGSVLGVRV